MSNKEKVIQIINLVLEAKFALDTQEILSEAIENWDSLKHLSIVFALEDEFDIRFSEDEFSELRSLSAIVTNIESKL